MNTSGDHIPSAPASLSGANASHSVAGCLAAAAGNSMLSSTIAKLQKTTMTTGKSKRQPLEPLVVDALRAAGSRGLVLADICSHVAAHCADYKITGSGEDGDDVLSTGSGKGNWQRNVRHILSVRSFFVKTGELNPTGRGGYWKLDERKYIEYVNDKRMPTGNSNVAMTSGDVPTRSGPSPSTVGCKLYSNSSTQQVPAGTQLTDYMSSAIRLSALQDHQSVVTSVLGPNQCIDWAVVTSQLTRPDDRTPCCLLQPPQPQHQLTSSTGASVQWRQGPYQPLPGYGCYDNGRYSGAAYCQPGSLGGDQSSVTVQWSGAHSGRTAARYHPYGGRHASASVAPYYRGPTYQPGDVTTAGSQWIQQQQPCNGNVGGLSQLNADNNIGSHMYMYNGYGMDLQQQQQQQLQHQQPWQQQ